MTDSNKTGTPQSTEYVNNHIHTSYSFSPYSPADAVLQSKKSGLTTAGIMDHDTVAGAKEFIEAGRSLHIATTVGFECRVSMKDTPFANRRINNPDQAGIAYVACHGIPHQNLELADRWRAPFRMRRNDRNRQMTARLNEVVGDERLALDFDRDIVSISRAEEGGSITERHILFALAKKMTAVLGPGMPVVDFIKSKLNVVMDDSTQQQLIQPSTDHYDYVLLGVLKSGLVKRFYIDATDECPAVLEFVRFAHSIGAIPAYAYLGDVGQSVTGDKKPQQFEDAYLDELIVWLAQNGFDAVTYMPTRNTPAQLQRIMALCNRNNLFQISGEDINSPTQQFICAALEQPEYRHLIEATWALIGHEAMATQDIENGLFTTKTIAAFPMLGDRIAYYAAAGRRTME